LIDALPVTLRVLQEGDAPALLRFYNSLSPASIRTFRPLGERTSLDVCRTIVQDTVVDGGTRIDVVATHNNAIVGWAFVSGLEGAEPGLGLAVLDAFHGQGLGSALLDLVLDYTRRRGVPTVYLVAVKDNLRAIKLYESRGFVFYGEHVDEMDQLPYVEMSAQLCAGKATPLAP